MSFVAHNSDKLFQSDIKTENSTILSPIISAVVLGKDVKDLKMPVVVKILLPLSKVSIFSMKCKRKGKEKTYTQIYVFLMIRLQSVLSVALDNHFDCYMIFIPRTHLRMGKI